jgi:RNA polymerase sigma factor (sigma-70 family)
MQYFDQSIMNDPIRVKYLNNYYECNGKKLHKVVDKILRKFGGIHDREEYYSLANEVFPEVLMNYDNRGNFDSFLYTCLYKRICNGVTKSNCNKRKNIKRIHRDGKEEKIYLADISFDAPIKNGSGEEVYLKDLLASNYILEEDLSDDIGLQKNEKIEKYLDRLSKKQRRIVELLMDGESAEKIRGSLGITQKEYYNQMTTIRSYRNTKVLFF